jgi:hypothetical protein
MALPEAFLFAARSWPSLREQIEPQELDLIRHQLAAAVHGGDWDPDVLMRTLFGHEDESYPGWRALAERPARGAATLEPPMLVTSAAELRLRVEEDVLAAMAAKWSEEEEVDPEQVEREAEECLWVVPMRQSPAEEEGPLVIVLERAGERLAPAFQFAGEEGEVAPGVAEVNRLLDASEDPWGAASWWLTPHAALHAIPADALRAGEGEIVLAAARAASELE